MVESQAPHGATRRRYFAPRAGDGKYILPPHGVMICVLDFLIISIPPANGSLLLQNTESLTKNLCFWLLLSLLSILLAASHGGYGANVRDRGKINHSIAANCFLATSAALISLAIILGHPNILARHWVVLDLIVTPFLLTGMRKMLSRKLTTLPHHHTTPGPLVICFGTCPSNLPKAFADRNLSDHIDGVLYLTGARFVPPQDEWPLLPDLAALRVKLLGGGTRDVVFVHPPAPDHYETGKYHALWDMILTCPARIWIAFDVAPSLPDLLRGCTGEYKLVPIVTDDFLNSNNSLKRIFDICAASLALTFAAPLLLLCAGLIRASSPGPIMFRQLRTGAHGRQFEVLKFRTMAHDPGRAFSQASRNDPSITNIGRWLRRSSLDEMPQLINVIRGDMSLVGPRPHAPETKVEGISFEDALKLYQIRHRVKPGMTGLAQIRGLRGATPMLKNLEQRLASDLEYIQSWSIWLDLSILMQTVPAVFAQTNAW